MRWYLWRWRVAREFMRRSDMNLFQAWDYSDCMRSFYDGEFSDTESTPVDAVETEMSYWDRD